MPRFSQLIASLSCILLAGGVVGCASLRLPFGEHIPKATAADPVTQILCLWQPSDGIDHEQKPCKGYNGQILFLTNRTASPVEIEGEVRIYLFHDKGDADEQSKPIHIFNFDNRSWAVHLGKSALGPTYTVFVPYSRRENKDVTCGLRIRYKAKRGPIVYSEFTNMSLNGSKKQQRGADAKPFDVEETDRMKIEEMTSALRRTTTISMAHEAQAPADTNGPASDSNPIQQASHEIPAARSKAAGDANQIRQMEGMVQQLLDMKSAGVLQSPAASNVQNTAEPNTLEQPPNGSTDRLRLDRPRRVRQRAEDEPPKPLKRRVAHPLDDEPASERPMGDDPLAREPQIGHPFDSEDAPISDESEDELEPYRRSPR